MIRFTCEQCGKAVSVKEEFAGKTGKCPHCKKPAQIPWLPNEVEPVRGKATQAQANTEQEVGLSPSAPSMYMMEGWSRPRGMWGRPIDFLSPAQSPDEIGRLGPYRILKVLGAGGMGVVFLAEDLGLKRKVALKAMQPALAACELSRKRFLREAQTAAAIEHDHIVHIYQVGEDRGVPFIAMQFLKGETLDERLKRNGRLSLKEVFPIGQQIALGLAAAHEQGLVHRDIKPANIWLESRDPGAANCQNAPTPAFRVKILDFGLARAAADKTNLTQSGAIVGTPAYISPEQANAKPVDARTDLFSLGCVLYRIATGELPFKGVDTLSLLAALALETPTAPRELNPAISRQFSDLIMKLLAKSPADRPASAAAVAELLAKLEKEVGHPEPSTADSHKGLESSMKTGDHIRWPEPAIKDRPATRPRRYLLMLGIGGAATVVVIAAAIGIGLMASYRPNQTRRRPAQPDKGTITTPQPNKPASGKPPHEDDGKKQSPPQEQAITATPEMSNPKRHQEFVDLVKKGDIEMLFFGDSITDAWRKNGSIVWEETFKPMKAVNFGIGGDRTQHVLWRIQNGELDGIRPRVVVLMIGSANLMDNSPKEIALGIKAIVKEIRNRQHRTAILLLGIFPRGELPNNPLRGKIKAVNMEVANLDDGKLVKYLDIGGKFLEKDGTLSKEIMGDFIHPSARGYQIWADSIKAPLQELMNKAG